MTLGDSLFTAKPWLITPDSLRSFHAAARAFFNAPPPAPPPQPESELLSVEDGVGIVSIAGPFMRNPDILSRILFGATDTESIMAAIREADSRDDVRSVLLDIDSPGGAVNGTPELASAVSELSRRKRVYAFSAGELCSAAYWIASQADAIYATPSARIGSIGVILAMVDSTEALKSEGLKVEIFAAGKFKSAGADGVPLTDEQRAWLQGEVDEIAAEFRSAVLSRGRRIPDEAMEGQTFSARHAMRLNLSGVVASRAEALARLRSLGPRRAVDTAALSMHSDPSVPTAPAALTVEQELAAAHARIQSLEADARAGEQLLDEARAEIAQFGQNISALTAARDSAIAERDCATAQAAKLRAIAEQLAARNAELEAAEKDLEKRASLRAAQIVAETGTREPAPVTPKADSATEDLVARFRAITEPAAQTAFWRSLTAQQQALILKATA